MRSTAFASACFGTMHRLLHSFTEHIHKPPVKFPISSFHFSSLFLNTPNSKNSCAPLSVNWNFCPDHFPKPVFWDFYHQHDLDNLPDPDTKDEDRKVKLICSFGGKILPRGGDEDGDLHYIGGQNRIIALSRDITFQEFCCKMEKSYGSPVRICYQLPDRNLDILVSIHNGEDLENMMEEFDYLSKVSNHESGKIRIFLFPLLDREYPPTRFNNAGSNISGSSYIDPNKEAVAIDANTGKRHSKGCTKHVATTRNSNVRGKVIINNGIDNTSALENQNFQIRSNVVGTSNVATQNEKDIKRHHLDQQQRGDSTSLFSDQDPWKILGYRLSNILGDPT